MGHTRGTPGARGRAHGQGAGASDGRLGRRRRLDDLDDWSDAEKWDSADAWHEADDESDWLDERTGNSDWVDDATDATDEWAGDRGGGRGGAAPHADAGGASGMSAWDVARLAAGQPKALEARARPGGRPPLAGLDRQALRLTVMVSNLTPQAPIWHAGR